MGWLSDVAGALTGGVVSGLFGMSNARDAQNRQAEQNEAVMRMQHEFNVDDYKHRYQWSVNDMRAAGLNPILAVTNGIGGSINGTGLAQSSAIQSPTPDFASAINSAVANRNQREVALKGLELQERATAVQEMDAETRRLDVENQIANRAAHLDLDKAAQKFDQDLKKAWQDFAMENQQRLTELKAQETAANIRHMAAQDANLATMAQVALRDVSVKEVLAKVAEENGISHRALEAAQAVCSERQSEFYEKYGHTQEAQEELARAQTALTNYKRSVAGVETVSDVMKGILSVAIAGKIGMDMIPSGSNSIGF